MAVKTSLAVLAGLTLAIGPALAQTTPTPAPDSRQVIPEKQAEPLRSGRSESLSKRLSRTDGVIEPNVDVDPGMKTPAPDASGHTMPVIPPSATGGDTAK